MAKYYQRVRSRRNKPIYLQKKMFKKSRDNNFNLENEPGFEWHSVTDNDYLRAKMHENLTTTVRKLANVFFLNCL